MSESVLKRKKMYHAHGRSHSIRYVFLLRSGWFLLVRVRVSIDDTASVGFVHAAIRIADVVLLAHRISDRAGLKGQIGVL